VPFFEIDYSNLAGIDYSRVRFLPVLVY